MKNPTYFCLTVLLSLFCMNAFAQIQLNGTYLIQNKQNRQNVISPSWENFNVRMYASDVVYPDHQWVFTHLGGGKHSIQNVASGRYMTAQNAGCNLGINITSTTNINGDESRWLIEKRGSNYFIKPAHCTTHAIDKKGGNNGSVHLWQFNANNSNQHFDLISVTPINTQQAGEWSPIYEADMIPVAAAHLADGKILAWSSDGRFSFGSSGKTYTSIFDPADNSFSTTLVNNTGHNMFCPGIANTADGDIIVTGGSTSRKTTIYDVSSNSFKAGPNMNTPRGYHSMVTLNDGRVFAIGGSWSGGRFNKQAEVWTESTGWLSLANVDSEKTIRQGAPDPQGIYRDDNHAWLWAAPNSQVFQAGPGTNMHWINTIDQGGVTDAGLRGDDKYSMNGTSVMFDQGKILTMGGAESYGGRTNASNRSYVVDINGGQANVSRSGDMKQARVYHNSIVLPSGEVVAIGGMCKSAIFSDECASLNVDIWNPETGNWTAGAAMQVPRTYHSVAILMQDGRVWAAGGGLCGGCAVNHADAEIYSPPYLFDDNGLAARPTITNAPATADYSTDINVKTDKAVQDFVLVRMSSVTHSSNNEQRRIPLTFTDKGANNYTLNIPNKDWLPPGNYFLFALDNGVPSVAKIIKVGKNTLPGEEQLVEDGVYFIEALLTGQHLTSPTFDPNNVRMVAASEAGDQKWEITHLENNIYNIKNIQSDRFLNVANASCANDANVITSTNSSATNSRWIISKQGEEFFFRPLHCSTRAMDYQRDPNKNTVIWDFSIGNNNQRFIIKPATTTQVPEGFLTIDGVYLIKNRVNAQNVISTAANNFDVRMFSSANASQDHQWIFRHLGQGRHSVQNASSGRYMSVQNAGCDRGINVTTVAALNGDESFWLVEKKGSNHFLKPAHCTTHAMDKTSGDGQSAYIWEFGLNNGNQHFDLIFLEDAPNQLPSASFTATPSSGEAPLPVSFDASTSSDQDGDELTFRWDLGDGNTAFGEKINHIYTTAASYTVRLTVDDGEGQNTTSQIIEVLEVPNKPPTADFTASTTSGEAPLPVRFDASASSDEDGDQLSFQWDFGDGNTA
ncbi:MAG: PKD domain-containing protein, partial [Bacteroidota bacterium]